MNTQQDLSTLKRLATTVYLCQLLSFTMLGLPLLVGVAINFLNRKAVQGTWLESHFNWQIQTAWVTLAGFAVAGFTLEFGIGLYILIPTIMLLVYRIVIGWNALNAEREVKSSN
jgi:uncharacterized membrane protein